MPRNAITGALAAEAAALATVVTGLADNDLGRPSPCPPWTMGELLCHVLIATDRVAQALAGPDPLASAPIVGRAEYYRPDERFSAAANADRIETARSLASRLAGEGARNSPPNFNDDARPPSRCSWRRPSTAPFAPGMGIACS